MSNINPYYLLGFDIEKTPNNKTIKRAIRKLLVEFDLSEDNTIFYNGIMLSKNDSLNITDELFTHNNKYHLIIFKNNETCQIYQYLLCF